jgi:hypothetical protein
MRSRLARLLLSLAAWLDPAILRRSRLVPSELTDPVILREAKVDPRHVPVE